MRPARQEPDAAINRQRVRDGAVALSSDVDSRIPVSIKHKAVGAVVATSLADAVALTCAAVGLTGVCWLNRFNAPSGELCLVSQQFTEHADGYLMESVVVLLALCAVGAILLLAARGFLLYMLQFLHHENRSVGRVEQGLDGTVAHILAHAVLLPRLLLQSALRGFCAFTLKLAFEVSHLATLAKIVLVAERRAVAGHKEAAHTEVDADGFLPFLLHDRNVKGYGEPELTAAHEDERVAGRVVVEEFSQLGIEGEREAVALALRGSRHVDAVLAKASIKPLIKTHGEVLFLGGLGLPLLAVAPDGTQRTAHILINLDDHLRGKHLVFAPQPVIAGTMDGFCVQRHAVLLDELDTGIIRPGSLAEQTQPVVRHLLRGDEPDVVRQCWFAFSLAHDVCAIPLYISVPRMLPHCLVIHKAKVKVAGLGVVNIPFLQFHLAKFGLCKVNHVGLDDVIATLHVDHGLVAVIRRKCLTKQPRHGGCGEVTLQADELHLRHHLRQFLAHGVNVLEVEIDNLGLHMAALVLHIKTVEVLAEVVLQHLLVVASQRLRGFNSFHNKFVLAKMGQHCALLWLNLQSHRSLSADRRGYCPNGFNSLADTKIATYLGGINVPQIHFSTAKYGRNSHTRKYSFRKLHRKCYRT